jgi:hypothetical protein
MWFDPGWRSVPQEPKPKDPDAGTPIYDQLKKELDGDDE